MPRPIALALLALLLATAACRGPAAFPDERPEFLTEADLAGALLLGGLEGGVGSGVAVGPDLVLTARHVAEFLGEGPGPYRFRLGGTHVRGEVVAAGEGDRDWALLRVERPTWTPEDVVAIAEGVELSVPGRELWAAGYPAGAFPDRAVDPRVPALVIRFVEVESGSGLTEVADTGLDLAGLSGGGVFVRDAGRLALVGVFVAQVREASVWSGPFGLEVPFATKRYGRLEPVPTEALAAALGD